MVLEIAEVEIREDAVEDFAREMRERGLGLLSECLGVVSVRFGQGIENPRKFTFNVVWTSVEDHVAARELESFRGFSKVFEGRGVGGSMSHYAMDEAIPGASA
jgi:heme-degrading monooxygenase HmoA